METNISVQPAFNPSNVAASYDFLQAKLPYASKLLTGRLTGDSTMRSRGDGSEIRNIRDYEIGDDTRHIDWKVTARQASGAVQVRDFNRDIRPKVFVVTDTLQSRFESMANPEDYYSERTLALSACLGILQMASRQGLSSTIIAANDTAILTPLKPSRGTNHLLGTAHTLAKNLSDNEGLETLLKAGPETAIERPRLSEVIAYAGKQCFKDVVVVVSDFRDAAPDDPNFGWHNPIKKLKANGNSIITVAVNNPSDYKLPEHESRFVTEQGVVYIPQGKNGQEQRERYKVVAKAQTEAITTSLRAVQAHQIELSTDNPRWADSLRDQLRNR